MTDIIPYGRQNITEEDINGVINVLKSDFLTQGPKTNEFENNFASYIGSKHIISVSNGTAALHLAALALGVKANINVITVPTTFVASANAIRYCGGNVFFCDIDPETFLIDLTKLEDLIRSKPRHFFSGVIPVNLAGRAVDLEALKSITQKNDMWIIEDACHSPGGYFIDSNGDKQLCGNGNFADISVFSFHPVKHIAMGEGGAISTNNFSLFQRLKLLRTHGITKEGDHFENDIQLIHGNEDTNTYSYWYYEMQSLGYNYRLSDIQASLGITQLKRASRGLELRKNIAYRYHEALKNHPLISVQSGVVEGHAYHLYIINLPRRDMLFEKLMANNIRPQIHYIPVHLMPYYKKLGFKLGDFPNAENYYRKAISLPMYETLSDENQERVITTISTFI